jgi:glycosyltransferase involved in cell wall biosynthesis
MARPLRVAHIVTRVSSGGASGGPIAVAKAHLVELQRRGHDVTLYSGWDGKAAPPEGIRTYFFRTCHLAKFNFTLLTSPAMLIRLWRDAPSLDVAHVHLARDFVTLPTTIVLFARHLPVLIQTHGTVAPDSRPIKRVLDRLFVRPIFRRAAVHLVLTSTEERHVRAVESHRQNITHLGNGIGTFPFQATWDRADEPEILFCARLHTRKRVGAFIDMAEILTERGVKARFTIVGPDEGDLSSVRQEITRPSLDNRVLYEGAVEPEDIVERISQAQVFVLPSIDEPFPVTVLEAMTVGVPTVITFSNGVAPIVGHYLPETVTDGSARGLADATEQIIAGHAEWADISERAATIAAEHFNLESVIDDLESAYRRVSAVSDLLK